MRLLKLFIRNLLSCLKMSTYSIDQYLYVDQKAEVSEYERGSKVKNEWDDFYAPKIMKEFCHAQMSFLRQPTISAALHPNQQELARIYLDELSESEFCRTRILPRLHDMPIGDPYLCTFFPLASPLSIQHAYYFFLMKKYLGVFIPESEISHILEIGGGYGNFCRLTFDFGYSGRYVIADLPLMQSIQQHYLKHVLPERIVNQQLIYSSIGSSDTLSENKASLLIATFSLNETPLETRKLLEPHFSEFNYIFVAYNKSFDGLENCAYFKRLGNSLSSDFDVQIIKDTHRRAWFLMGKRKI
jgi:hypothetical protein